MPEKPGGFARLVFQKCSNSRRMGKVPKFQNPENPVVGVFGDGGEAAFSATSVTSCSKRMRRHQYCSILFDPRSFAPVRGALTKMTTRMWVLSCEFRGDLAKVTGSG
jgi:hypothetical protein